MVVNNFDIARLGCAVRPLEAKSPLAIDTDTELPLPIAAKRLEMVARQAHQVEPVSGGKQDSQALDRLSLEGLELLDALSTSKPRSAPIAIAWELVTRHAETVAQLTYDVKRLHVAHRSFGNGA